MDTMEKVMKMKGNSYSIRSLQKCDKLTVVQAVAPSQAKVFSICWGEIGKLPTNCGLTGDNPALIPTVRPGSTIDIKADLYNVGTPGRIMAIFKVNDVAIYTDTNISLGAFPAIWSPVYSGYKMPSSNIKITVEGYGWDGTKWILNSTVNATISVPATPTCTGIELLPFSAPPGFKIGDKLDMVVATSPGNIPFTVTFKDRAGAILGTCRTSGSGQATGSSTCPFTWDSKASYAGGGKAGTYYVKAYADSCVSIESVIQVSAPILQYNFGITIKDSATGLVVSGATVLVSTVGGASQSKVTDANGFVTFMVDSGTINVAISKDKYNTANTAEYIFMDKNVTYTIDPIPIIPTVGSIQFVSSPFGASIFIDSKAVMVGGTIAITPITLTDIKAGDHTFVLKLSGYEDLTGTMTVLSGSTIQIYRTLTQITPGTGSLNITSTPMGAEVWVDGKDTTLTTSGATVIDSIPPGTHSLTLTMDGFQDKTVTFIITAGQTTSLNEALVPLTNIGILDIDSEPSGARIYVNDKDTQYTTPATITNLSAGDYTYKVILSGYSDVAGKFTIKAGESTKVHLVLEKSGMGAEAGAMVVLAGVAAIGLLLGKKEE